MNETVQQTVNILARLDEDYKSFVLDFVKVIEHKQLSEKETRNSEYLAMIQRGIDQCAAGRGLRRDIIEVPEDE